ncbi:MAG: tetratricopeptide repeat protein [Deltaproteobacteria bacterium]|nr:tetratricopeptide repeat protein [Deltaproteobacteria bacterium]NIS77857.1 tetratricopeptide repeat protein [Deltaproteobacteria bacterium]
MDSKDEKKQDSGAGEDRQTGKEPKSIETFIDIAKFYFINKKYREALEKFEHCLSIDPGNEEVLLSIGLIHEVNNEIEKAKNVYQAILKKNPDNKAAKEKINKLSGL